MKNKSKKLKMKKMFAAVHAVHAEDIEDCLVSILGVYSTKEKAKKVLAESELEYGMCDDECDNECDEDCDEECSAAHEWFIDEVKVEI